MRVILRLDRRADPHPSVVEHDQLDLAGACVMNVDNLREPPHSSSLPAHANLQSLNGTELPPPFKKLFPQ